MKKFVFILSVVLALSAGTKTYSQLTDQDIVVFNAHLLQVLDIVVYSGGVQEITFAAAADYTAGVTEAGGIVPGYSEVSVESTVNWDMSIECPDFLPYAGPNGAGTGSIPINNLGVWCETQGAFTFGNQVDCAYQTAATSLGLSVNPVPLITNNGGNAGDVNENDFRLHWRMGTRDNASMNPATMFDQMQLGVFTAGDYTTTATLTVDEI
jgi:hypothetical protein